MKEFKPKDWTPEEIETVVSMVLKGYSMSRIAEALPGRTRNSVIGKWHRVSAARGLRTPTPRRRPILEDVEGEAPRISPQLLRNTTPKRVCEPRRPMPKVAKVGVGFLLPALPEPPRGPSVGILDVTGCKWAVGEDPSVPGLHTFCNHETDGKSAYCAYHHGIYRQKPVAKGEVKRFRVLTSLLRAGAA